ncbi:MAG: hypothetical protein K6D94_09890 [Clostridiales bacterium]|nr:hypothetical protein [Clostridiales bacterium]
MAFIHDRSLEKTGYQESGHYRGNIDVGCDFVMVYGTGSDMPERVREYKDQGYVVHLMTGIAWGGYQDYLFGRWDGRDHTDEGQVARDGSDISHGKDVPYMVPAVSFTDYLTEKLKPAVDAGVEAIHVEEPEFWNRGGYSEAFKREYRIYYGEPWQPPHESAENAYRCAQLKSYLYRRAISRVSQSLKEYAVTRYGRDLRFYVPTHSLINYTSWSIVSPEGALTDVPTLDGYIAQIWTGTSRTANVYRGVKKERTFETAYLEYGVMQELVRGTGRRMWFLHDPIEDRPTYDWDDYRKNYLMTVTASLLHPDINDYEITPWPRRVYGGKYPSGSPDAKPIPEDYATLLCSLVQTLGDMPLRDPKSSRRGRTPRVGVLISDSSLWQRTYTDDMKAYDESLGDDESAVRESFRVSAEFPDFYGLAMPLVKRGVTVRPVVADNVRRFTGYLDDYDIIVMSYEFIKPQFPDVNNAIDSWVRAGGTLVYVGDGSDPYNGMRVWWNQGKKKFETPAHHLFSLLGVSRRLKAAESEPVEIGDKGHFAYLGVKPAAICLDPALCDRYTGIVAAAAESAGFGFKEKKALEMKRGRYIIAARLDETGSDAPVEYKGLFADMYTPASDIITRKTLLPGENALLCDLEKLEDEIPGAALVGTSARIKSMVWRDGRLVIICRAADGINAHIRLKLAARVTSASCEWQTEDVGGTLLLSFPGTAHDAEITVETEQ